VLTLRLRDLRKHSLLADLTAASPPDTATLFDTLHRTVGQLVERADPDIAKTRLKGQAIDASHPVPTGAWWLGGSGLVVAAAGAIFLGTGASYAGNAVTVIDGVRYVAYEHQITGNTLGYVGQAGIGVGVAALAAAAIWAIAVH
jgi:hypothetical protein